MVERNVLYLAWESANLMPAEYAIFRRPKFLQCLKKWSQWCLKI